ncbi:hypothetical protein CL684_00150 [Candidatus Campbellbacteria bacterium]|nr:hypothetical protein [Candidatus Campbellbacteria bacterium]
MKKITTLFLVAVVMFGFGAQSLFAQEAPVSVEEELRQAQIEILERRIIELLQEQIAALSGGQMAFGECMLNYTAPVENTFALQTELQRQGYAVTKIDGKYGPETTAAVSAFQTANNLSVKDGMVNKETREALAAESIACGVTTAPMTVIGTCSLAYNGNDDVLDIQTELQRRGYAITKLDGKYGPETRAALASFLQVEDDESISITKEMRTRLAQSSLVCDGSHINNDSQEETNDTTPVTEPIELPTPEDQEVVETMGMITLVDKAAVARSTSGVPDDTVVFTYKLKFNNDETLYVSANPETAFDVNLFNQDSTINQTDGIDSIVSTGSRIRRSDNTTYFVIENGDTMSLRSSMQPGVGMYYGELARLSYTTDNVGTIAVPNIVQYGFDTSAFRTGLVRLLN